MNWEKPRVTDDELREAVASSLSMAEVLRKIDRYPGGTSHKHYGDRVRGLGISIDHFGQTPRSFVGVNLKRRSALQILINDQSMTARKSRTILVRALLELGRPYECVDCGLKDQWYGKQLFLEVDHIDGDWKNNIPENLRFLCPNCHSIYTRAQRASKKQRAVKKERIKKPDPECIKCGGRATKQSKSGVCRLCFARKEKIEWPPLEELEAMVRASNRLQVAKKLGVSWNSVDNHLNQR